MKKITATTFKINTGQIMYDVMKAPIVVTQHRRNHAVLIDFSSYEKLVAAKKELATLKAINEGNSNE
jgi:prevent-host-death family protein